MTEKFRIQKNRKYLITEKPTPDTPVELQRVGRAKMGGRFYELAGCPWDKRAKRYDTGLYKSSREFSGMAPDKVEKILEERKELIEYLADLVERHPNKSENEVLADKDLRLKLEHNRLYDTSDMDTYFRLYLAMRGNAITPDREQGNIGKYGSSMYVIKDSQEERDHKKELAKNKMKATRWLLNKLDSPERNLALEYLRYEDFIGLKHDKDDALLLDLFEKKIADYENLMSFLHTVDTVTDDDVVMYNDIRRKYESGQIKKEKNGYVYDGIELGANFKAVQHFLKKPEGLEVATRLFNNKVEA